MVERETAAQLFTRLSKRPTLCKIEPRFFQHAQTELHFMELSGPEGCGKTEILLHLVINTITPKVLNGQDFCGLDSSVLFVDTEYKFPMLRFISVLEQRLIQWKKVDDDKERSNSSEEFIKDCLERFFKVNCSSSLELLVTIRSLDKFLKSNPDISLVIIDNISAYHWIDELVSIKKEKRSLALMQMLNIISNLISDFGVNVIVTKPDFYQLTYRSDMSPSRFALHKDLICEDNLFILSKFSSKKPHELFRFHITALGIEFI